MFTGYNIYMLFTICWFLHMSSRIPVLGIVRFDLLLVLLMIFKVMLNKTNANVLSEIKLSKTNITIKTLIIYIIITLPFVEWPGSVINTGLENLIKALVFYYFTIHFITSEKKLKGFIMVFIGCQTIRIIEPLYLHVTQGYWGSTASMSGWEYMYRLAGAPNDIVNPNGLAFIVLTIIPFYYYLYNVSIASKTVTLIVIPLSIYTLLLTGSRSGLIGLFVILGSILIKSSNKIFVTVLIGSSIILSYNTMSANFKDRYGSIFNSNTKNSSTAEGRKEGLKRDIRIALRKPLFGHGLGTSREANANFSGEDKPSHNLYTEVAEELGFIGLIIFLMLMKTIIDNYNYNKKTIKEWTVNSNYLISLNDALQVWLLMNILFSVFSYGLSSYEWYLFSGVSIVLKLIIMDSKDKRIVAQC